MKIKVIFTNTYLQRLFLKFWLILSLPSCTVPLSYWQKPSRKGYGKRVSLLEIAHRYSWLTIFLWEAKTPETLTQILLLFLPLLHCLLISWVFSHPIGQISWGINMKMYFYVVMLLRWIDDFLISDHYFILLLNWYKYSQVAYKIKVANRALYNFKSHGLIVLGKKGSEQINDQGKNIYSMIDQRNRPQAFTVKKQGHMKNCCFELIMSLCNETLLWTYNLPSSVIPICIPCYIWGDFFLHRRFL